MRIELGPKDLDKGQVCVKMRTGPDVKKEFVPEAEFLAGVRQRLEEVTQDEDLSRYIL